MFFNPHFLHKNLTDIHNDVSQHIQGGAPGEHYHLTQTVYNYLLSVYAAPIYAEPVMSLTGEITVANSGDIVMHLFNVPG